MNCIISDEASFAKSLAYALKSYGFSDVYFSAPNLGEVKSRLNKSATAIIDAHLSYDSHHKKGGFAFAKELRTDRELKFKGKIILVSFAPVEHLKGWRDSEILELQGSFFLQIPFRISELKELLASPEVLSEEQWERIARRLSRKGIATIASKLRHDYDGVFTQPLSHLRELEKLSYFDKPDFEKVLREIASVQRSLTKEKLQAFSEELRVLLGKMEVFDFGDESITFESLKRIFEDIEGYLTLLSSWSNDVRKDLGKVLEGAKEVRSAINRVLSYVTEIKEEVLKGGNDEQ